jgi:Ca2+-binding EF-hand superfamily protein
MGSKPSRVGLTEHDLDMLHRISEQPRDQIVAWFEMVKAECASGKLDKAQFIKFYKLFPKKSGKASVEEIAEQCFNVFDADKNGVVDLGEFLLVYVTMNGADVDSEQKLNYVFYMYDQDNNGVIDGAELQMGLKTMFEFLGIDGKREKSAAKIIAYLDENKDGMINKREFIEGLLSDPYLIKYMSPFY